MGRLAVSGKLTPTRAYRTNSAGEDGVTVVAGHKTDSGTVEAASSSAKITIARWRNRVIGGPE